MSPQLLVLATEAAGGAAEHGGNGFLLGHDLAEVLWSAAASIIMFAFLWWKVAPPARAALAARTDRIAAELSEAEQTARDGQARLDEVTGRIASAEDERQRILVEARQTAEALKQQIVARAEAEAEALLTRAAGDIESSKHQAIADLHAEIAGLALGAAGAVVARNLDPDTQNELIDGYIEQVSAAPSGAQRGYQR
jgi:F-type H+-transporting ATPase subunit b